MLVLKGLRRATANFGAGISGLAPEAAGLFPSATSSATTSASSSSSFGGGRSSGASSSSSTSGSASSPSVGGENETDFSILKYPYQVIDTEALLTSAVRAMAASKKFALDIEAYCTNNSHQKQLGTVSLLQVCPSSEPVVFLIDVVRLGVPTVIKHIGPVMTDNAVQKLMFDCRRDVEAMSSQMKLKPQGVLDIQLFFTSIQWKAKSVSRRSGMTYVLKNVCNLTRQEGDSAVQAAMTLGSRPVWDVRPLPPHFLEYAADDVRHILMLSKALQGSYASLTDPVARLTAQYVDHYAVERPVEVEADPKPHEVSADWLERFIGPGGRCGHCGMRGHVDSECFKKQTGNMRCSHCGEMGHLPKNCYKKFPQLLKCELCGQMGHTKHQCFQRNKCAFCGGGHRTDSCHKKLKQERYEAERAARQAAAEAAEKEAATAAATAASETAASSPTPAAAEGTAAVAPAVEAEGQQSK